jgi:protein-S-isoprenylcysteine O-methyltransferase Ste14
MTVPLLRLVIFPGVMAGVLFGAAGRWDLPSFWAVSGVSAVWLLVSVLVVDPGLHRERFRELRAGGKDFLPMLLLVLPCLPAQWLLAGLDVGRYHWSDVPGVVQLAGLAGAAAGAGLVCWALAVNPFFVGTVRLQPERGQHLIAAGPYRYVRHPGYLGAVVCFLSTSLALGSWWSLVPVAPVVLMVLRRTALEDRFLRAELGGYAAYADKTPYRLVPGLW